MSFPNITAPALLFFNSRTKAANVNVFTGECREDRSMALRLLAARNPFK